MTCYGKDGNEIEDRFNYSIDESNGEMSIWYGEHILCATISDCDSMSDQECEDLMFETLEDLGYKFDYDK